MRILLIFRTYCPEHPLSVEIPNTLFDIDYDPSLDLLQVAWPSYGSLSVPEFEYAVEHLIETLRLYDIPRLLLDARGVTAAPDLPEQLDLGIRFIQALEATRVRKVARLVSDTASRDRQLRQQPTLPYQFQTFVRPEVALAWLSV